VPGLTYDEIGELLGCSGATARRWADGEQPPLPKGRPVRFNAPPDGEA